LFTQAGNLKTLLRDAKHETEGLTLGLEPNFRKLFPLELQGRPLLRGRQFRKLHAAPPASYILGPNCNAGMRQGKARSVSRQRRQREIMLPLERAVRYFLFSVEVSCHMPSLDFTGGGARNLVRDVHTFGHLEVGQTAAAKVLDLLGGGMRLEHD